MGRTSSTARFGVSVSRWRAALVGASLLATGLATLAPTATSGATASSIRLAPVATAFTSVVQIPVSLVNGHRFTGLRQSFAYDARVLDVVGVTADVASQDVQLHTRVTGVGRVTVTGSGPFSVPYNPTTLYYLDFRAVHQSPVRTDVRVVSSSLGGVAMRSKAQSSVRLVSGWVSIGPRDINTGSGLHASQAGVVADVAFSTSDPSILYVASGQAQPVVGPGGYSGSTGEGGLYKSVDGGTTWSWENLGLDYTDVAAVAVEPANPRVVVIEVDGPNPTTGSVYKSINGGATWQQTDAAGGYGLFTVGTMLYATTFHALLVSSDFGTSWSTVSSFPSEVLTSAAVSDGGRTVYAGVWHASSQYQTGVNSDYAAVLKSTDGGRTYTKSLVINNLANPSISQIVVNPGNTANLFAIVSTPYPAREYGNPSLYESSDGGGTWTMIDTPDRGLPSGTPAQYVAVDPTNPDHVFVGVDGGLYTSTDDGSTFTLLPNLFFDVRCLVIDPANDQSMYLGTDQGLYVTADGATTWTPLNDWPGTLIFDVAVNASQIFTTVQDMSPVYSPDGGATWSTLQRGEEGIVAVDPYNPQIVVLWTEPHVTGFFWVSSDGGRTFVVPQINESQQVNTNIWTSSGIGFSSTGAIYVAGGAGIMKSNDEGQSWSLLSGSPAGARTVAVSPHDPAVVYASNWNGTFVSSDGGATWRMLNPLAFNSLAVDPTSSDVLVASQYNPSLNPSTFGITLNGQVFVSTDGGQHFSATSMGSVDHFTSFPQVQFVTGPRGPVAVFTCQEGVFISFDRGKTWHDVSFNLPSRAVTALTIASDGTAYAATYGAGIWIYRDFLTALAT